MLGYDGESMRRPAALLLFVIVLAGCRPAETERKTALVGAVLIDGAGGPPVSDSVVVVSGDRIAAAGTRGIVAIPADANIVNGAGKYLIPALIDVCSQPEPPATIRPANAEDARAQVAQMGARNAAVLHLAETAPALITAMEAARNAGLRIAGHISTQAGARLMVDNGASLLIGVPRDTSELDSALLARMRSLRVVVAPALREPVSETEARNTAELFRAGVPIGLASEGRDSTRQAELLASAGVPPLDVIVAGTLNSALALGQQDQRGTIQAGKRADLLLLSANPGEDIANLRRVALRMAAGEWVR